MKVSVASNILKILLIIFSIGVIFVGVYVLPVLAGEMAMVYPEIEYARLPVLIMCETLLVLLLAGIGIIMYLLRTFDKGFTFSKKFLKGLEVLVWMCIAASIGIIIIYQYITMLGGPDPATGMAMVGVTFIVWIVAAVIMLIRAIVKQAIAYKDDYDLTV
ncbi:MAG: DUF2975 domain-containing protein [Clostridiales bacterium]|nr:DUF2975 domain-containing protein [Clostridiales bacterium]